VKISDKKWQLQQRIEGVSGVDSWQNHGKKEIRLCKEDFTCDLK
jgi:hypothetical protein